MENKKVYVCRKIDQAGLNKLNKVGSLKVEINKENQVLTKEELISKAKGAEAIITLLTDKIDREVIDGIGKQLKIIANYAVGFDNIDIEVATERGIVVTNTPEVMTQAVAEHAIALILACARRIVEGDKFVRSDRYKKWEPELLLGPEIAGKKIGIVGMGRIGESLAKIGYHGFGMKVLYHDLQRNEEIERNLQADYASLNTLLENSDFISLHVPLNKATHHLISHQEFKIMKKNAVLINTARGAVIDEKALTHALKEKEIFAAGIDVFEFEPKPTKELYRLNNIILTPHIASATNEARAAMSECACENVIEVLMGRQPKNPVN
jgi:glyoxylate reductase